MKRFLALLKTWAQKLRNYVSPVFLAMLAVSFTLWYISKLNYTYTTDFNIKVKVNGERIVVPCVVEGKGTTLFGYGFYASRRANIPLSELNYDVVQVPATPEEGEYFKIEEGKGYYIEQAINDTDTMKVRIDITGHSVGDYISVAEGKDVYSYVLTGDALIDEKMSNQNKLVTTRYEYRWSDAETMNWNSNYGQAGQDGLDDGTFTFTVVNRKGFEIPSTGGMGVMPYILGGGMIVLVGGVGMMKLKKKED